jgi:hypothetical protein
VANGSATTLTTTRAEKCRDKKLGGLFLAPTGFWGEIHQQGLEVVTLAGGVRA